MSAHLQTLLLATAIGAVYVWLHTPALSFYSLQAFSLIVILYFAVKRLSNSKFWHIAPTAHSTEMVLVTLAFLLLIGSTGNTNSFLYPLTYIHLFFLVFSTHLSTSLIIGPLLIAFHYALITGSIRTEIPELITIPLMVIFFLFAKHQYNEVVRERKIIEVDEKALSNSLEKDQRLTRLLTTFVVPKINQIKEMALYADKNRDAIIGQAFILQMEIGKFLDKEREHEETT